MLKNNIEEDVKNKCMECDITQAKLAGKIHTTPSYVNRLIKKDSGLVNNMIVKMFDALGYDIELTYVKKSGGGTTHE